MFRAGLNNMKKKVIKRKRKNPATSVKLKLNNEELSTLELLRTRYDSPRILLDAYDDKNGSWDMNIVARAFIATKDDGGKIGTVPNISGNLKKSILELFGIVIDNNSKLDINTQMDLMKVLK